MNFQTIPPVPKVKELLDLAFGKARTKGHKKLKGDRIQILKTRETTKLDIIKDDLRQRLDKVVKSFPAIDQLPVFYQKLLRLTLDYVQLKKSLGAMAWAKAKISLLHKEHVRKIVQERSSAQINPTAKQFYGRVSSVLRQIQPNLASLEAARRTMKQYPDIKEMVTVCIYGFPNVGKSTLLNNLTGSKAKVEAYAFTTTGINAGYLQVHSKDEEHSKDEVYPKDKASSKHAAWPKIQLLDVPGTLAREDKMNNIERIAELAVQELAHEVIYVFDITEYCGFSIQQQLELFHRLEKNRNVLVYISKADLQDQAAIDAWASEHHITHYSLAQLQQKIAGLVVSSLVLPS